MGHISPHAVKMLVKGRQVTGLTLDMTSEVSFCEACAKVKPTCKTLPKEHGGPHVTNIGEKVHLDIWGPATPQSLDGREYFISFMDEYTHWSHIETMSCKAEALTCYKGYEAWLETQHATKLKQLQTDCSGKYLSHEFDAHLKACGTVCSLTIHDTPEERMVYQNISTVPCSNMHT